MTRSIRSRQPVDAFHLGVSMRRSFLSVFIAPAALLLTLASCSSPAPAEPAVTEPVASPVSYPIPEGCPTAEQFSEEMAAEIPFTALNFSLLSSQVEAPLLDGGCAYVNEKDVTSADGQPVKFVYTLYFNLGAPNHRTLADFDEWALSVGGTQSDKHSFSLPTTYTGLTEASAFAAGEDVGSQWLFGDVLPEYAQGTQGIVKFWLTDDQVAPLVVEDGETTTNYDAATALAEGLKLQWGGSVNVANEDGYTAAYELSGALNPFVSDVADSKPGEFAANASGTVSGTVTNTTDQRNASFPGLSIIALYPRDSAGCTSYNGIAKKGGDWQKPDYCSIVIARVGASELTPGQALPVPAAPYPISTGPHTEGSDALLRLNAPVSIYAYFGGESVMTTPKWTSPQGCTAPTMSQGGQSVVVMEGWPDLLCG